MMKKIFITQEAKIDCPDLNDYNQSHPKILFDGVKDDIWILLQDYIENVLNDQIYDQNRGEFTLINKESENNISAKYILYEITFESEQDEFYDFEFEINGYFISQDVLFIKEIEFIKKKSFR